MSGTCSILNAAHKVSMDVVAMSRKDAIRENTPLSISVTMETMPPVITKPPSCVRGVWSRKGFTSPTAHTSGRTMPSL